MRVNHTHTYTCLYRLLPEKRKQKNSSAASCDGGWAQVGGWWIPKRGRWGEMSGCCLASRPRVMESPYPFWYNHHIKLLDRNHESSNPSKNAYVTQLCSEPATFLSACLGAVLDALEAQRSSGLLFLPKWALFPRPAAGSKCLVRSRQARWPGSLRKYLGRAIATCYFSVKTGKSLNWFRELLQISTGCFFKTRCSASDGLLSPNSKKFACLGFFLSCFCFCFKRHDIYIKWLPRKNIRRM